MRNSFFRRSLILLGLVLCACDETNVTSTAELFNARADQDSLFSTTDEVVDSVKNVYGLDNCTSERSGKFSFVLEDNSFYLCDDGDWVESREGPKKVSSSSVTQSSSSREKSSSSEKTLEISSSSQEKSSSSVYKPVKYDCATYKCVTTEYLNQEMLAAGKYGEYLDVRDSQVYRTIVIGSQTWMAQNLNYNYKVGGASYGNLCYESKSDNCSKYGKLYTWGAAMDSAGVFTDRGKGCGRGKTCSPSYTVRGICPEGWHLPDTTEWNALLKVIGGETGSAKKLKAANSWITGYMGTDDYGFSALPTGNCPSSSECADITKSTDIWSSTEYSTLGAYYRYTFVDAWTPNNMILDYQNKSTARPIRCVEGDSLRSTAKSSSSSSAIVPRSSSSVSNAVRRLFVDLGDEVYSTVTSGQPVSVELVGMPDTSSLGYIAIYFEPNLSGDYARDLDIKAGKDGIYRIRQHMYASNRAPVVQEDGYVTSFTPVVDMSTDNLDDRTVHYYWSGWTSGLGHFKIVFDRENLVFYLYVEDTYLGYGTLSNDPIVMDNIELAREQPYGTNTCELSNVRVAGFSTLDAAKAWDGLAF